MGSYFDNTLVSYLYSDQLGSVSVVADGTGSLVSKTLYHPWGTTRHTLGTTPTDYAFTGQMQEGDIYFYNARWYDPLLGRFLQADTIVPPTQGTQGFDRFAYVNNNPLLYTDPSGQRACDDYYGSGCAVFSQPSSPQINYQEAVGSYGYSLYGLSDFSQEEMRTIYSSLVQLGRGLERLGVSDGKHWIKKNMGGVFMQGITIQRFPPLRGNCFVLNKLIYLTDDFNTSSKWNTPKGTAASMLIHENWHVFAGFSTYFPGGPVGGLMETIGGESNSFFQFKPGSLNAGRNRFQIGSELSYGNTAPAEYFAVAATALMFDPNHPGVPFAAREFLVNMILEADDGN